jgi:hypothetical protein
MMWLLLKFNVLIILVINHQVCAFAFGSSKLGVLESVVENIIKQRADSRIESN